ncbi:ABC-three component system protein [Thiohalomonas denitrificans]|uniref:ABC-three component system protein n=1 Tax=Thiohalomonas denitrificans TaxID=415747 RepID=UPI0026F1D7D3|nr:ABC-three component system protein [Thiohalomonas denitrificans]
MDDVERAFRELQFKTAYLEKKGNEFQDWFATIMEKRFPGDFIRVRPWGKAGDRKNDGYVRSKRWLFQVYAPNDMSAKAALAKIDEDYTGALPCWQEYFDTWIFMHNSKLGLGPDVAAKLVELDGAGPPAVVAWGFEELRRIVFELKVAELASLFGPVPQKRDIVNLGLESLSPVLDHISAMEPSLEPDLRPPPADKIDRNMLSEHVAILLKAGMTRVDLVRKYFRVQPGRRDEIAESFRHRYDEVRSDSLSPDETFAALQRHAAGDGVPSPSRQSAALAVLAFFFEECDIFEREGVQGGTA